LDDYRWRWPPAIGKSFQTVYRQIKRNSEIDAS
jgi:hypothetical protein